MNTFKSALVVALTFFAVVSFSQDAQANGTTFGSCSIVMPGNSDANNYSCSSGTAFGVAYNGYFMSESPCFDDISSALSEMNSIQECRDSDRLNNCAIVYPGSSDQNNYSCSSGTAFGVAFNGFFISSSPCYSDFASAIEAMHENAACQ